MIHETKSSHAEWAWRELNVEIGMLRSELLRAHVRELDQLRKIENYRTEVSELKIALSTRSSLLREAQPYARTINLIQPFCFATLSEHREVEKEDLFRFKQEVMDHSIKMNEVRQRSADEHVVLLRRIAEERDEAAVLRSQCHELERELILAGTLASDMKARQLRQINRLTHESDQAHASAAELARSLRKCGERDAELQRHAAHALTAAQAAATREAELVELVTARAAELGVARAVDSARCRPAPHRDMPISQKADTRGVKESDGDASWRMDVGLQPSRLHGTRGASWEDALLRPAELLAD
jgi:hypothetical protein